MHGRLKKEDEIDHQAGIVLNKKIGDQVEIGDALAYIHTNKPETIEKATEKLKSAYTIGKTKPEKYKDILKII